MPSRAVMPAGAGTLASVLLCQSPCLLTAFMSARNGDPADCWERLTVGFRRRGQTVRRHERPQAFCQALKHAERINADEWTLRELAERHGRRQGSAGVADGGTER
jgi:hypothetical protein